MNTKKSQEQSTKVLFVRIDSKLDRAMDWEAARVQKTEGIAERISKASIARRILRKYMTENGCPGYKKLSSDFNG